jgi:hypothetical protein
VIAAALTRISMCLQFDELFRRRRCLTCQSLSAFIECGREEFYRGPTVGAKCSCVERMGYIFNDSE